MAALGHDAAVELLDVCPNEPLSEIARNHDAPVGYRTQCLAKLA